MGIRKTLLLAIFLVMACCFATACNRNCAVCQSPTAPTPPTPTPTCAYSLSETSKNFPATGGNGSFTVSTTSACAWKALSNSPWLTVTAGSSGTGTGTVSYTVSANTGSARTGTITVEDKVYTVTQDAVVATPPPAPPTPECDYTIAPTSQNFPNTGGTGTIAVSTSNGCPWVAVPNASWVTITSGPSGTSNGTVGYSVAPNTGPARSATISIGNKTFTVTQDAVSVPTPTPTPSCDYSINPTTRNFPNTGGTDTVSVTTTGGCAWTAVSNSSWLTVTSGANGNGNGTVGYSVAANPGPARSGTITIAGKTFTVTQEAVAAPTPTPSCDYTIAPTSQNFPNTGGTGTIAVSTSNGCPWVAVPNASWVTITSGPSGTSNGTVGYSVAPNTGPARSATISIGNKTFTVTQDVAPPAPTASCVYAAPTSVPVPTLGLNGSSSIGTNFQTCAWTAVSDSFWLQLKTTLNGNNTDIVHATGTVTIYYVVGGNGGATRTGHITITDSTLGVVKVITFTQTGSQ